MCGCGGGACLRSFTLNFFLGHRQTPGDTELTFLDVVNCQDKTMAHKVEEKLFQLKGLTQL